MDVLTLSRLQFAATIAFHYLYPPLSIGLGVMLVIMEGAVAQDRKPALSPDGAVLDEGLRADVRHRRGDGHRDGVRVRHELGDLLALSSATCSAARWRPRASSRSSSNPVFWPCCCSAGTRSAASCISSPPAWSAWARISARSGSSWPIPGCRRRPASTSWAKGMKARAEITDFWADGVQSLLDGPAVPHAVRRVAGGRVPGGERERLVSAEEASTRSSPAPRCASGLVVGLAASLLQLVSGHSSALGVAKNQPAKLAAFEGLYETTAQRAADRCLAGWTRRTNASWSTLHIPGC